MVAMNMSPEGIPGPCRKFTQWTAQASGAVDPLEGKEGEKTQMLELWLYKHVVITYSVF